MTAVVAGTRGVTRIADKVVARIAEQAAGGTGSTGGVGRTLLGVPMGGERKARTDVQVRGDHVTAHVELAVAYPEPVREVTRQVRENVCAQVRSLTGLNVSRVDIDVASLEPEPVPAGRAEVTA